MPERHSVDFIRASFNIISDAERRTIALQFDMVISVPGAVERIVSALYGRYGSGIRGRLNRWRKGERSPLVMPSRGKPHPENPDVIRFEIVVKQGERLESALATLLGFLRQQPGYQRTFGPPLDRDEAPSEDRKAPAGDVSEAAGGLLKRIMDRRSRRVR